MPIIQAFRESDIFGQLILLILFFLSIFAWSTILRKFLFLRQSRIQSALYYEKFKSQCADFCSMREIKAQSPCPFYEISRDAQSNISQITGERNNNYTVDSNRPVLNVVDMELIEKSLDRCISKQTLGLEENLNLLATSASVSPFLGLLGTVWGVLIAFQDMARMESAQIGAVTRGISGALVTTVVGLLVAIPSLVVYNYMVNNIRRFETEMENFASEILAVIERQYLKR